jgi:type IV secretory pathway VirB10-like protein
MEKEIEREPNPQPLPDPTGPFDQKTRIKIASIAVLLVLGIALAFFFMSRAPQQQGVMGPRQQQTKQQQVRALDEEREKEYERKAQQSRDVDAMNKRVADDQKRYETGYQPAAYQTRITPTVQEKKEIFTGNMVEVKNNAGFGRGASVGNSNGNLPVAAPYGSSGNRDLPAKSEVSSGVQEARGGVKTVPANYLPEGQTIFCALVNQLSGDNTGPVKVQVSNDVYFPGTRTVAIPQGSLILGEASQVSAQFQQRLAVSFHLLQIGQTAGNIRQISLDRMPGLDQQGAAAVRDKVDNHFLQAFGASLAIGAIGGLSQIGNGNSGGIYGYDPSQQIRQGIAQSTAQSSASILQHFLNRKPTITIRPGTPVLVYLRGNVEIPDESL